MFDIEKFNIVEDNEFYYVFRSLEAGDISDIEAGITSCMRTDRERYKKNPKYKEDSKISLEEMFDHIKIHYRQDTNCISFTTNAGIASLYGRDHDSFDEGVFNDQYVILKIPKAEMGVNSHFAPLYFIEEINKIINKYYEEADDITKKKFDLVDNCVTQDELDSLTKAESEESIFEGGIEFSPFKSAHYSTLSIEQNLEKNKLIAKINLLPFDILSNASNKFLIQTLGSSFASMEVTHYQSIDSKYLINCPTYILDIFSILQQSNNSKVKDIEKIIIEKLSNNELNGLEPFKYYNYELTEQDLSIDNLYLVSDNGKVDYDTMRNLYIKTFYLAKSKLRAFHSVKLLRQILGNSYDDVLSELLDTYGIEPQVVNKQSISKIKLTDSIGLSYSTEIEKKLFNIFINTYNINDYKYLLDNKQDCVSMVMLDLLSDEYKDINKEDYYANAIIDAFDWSIFNVKSIELRHRINLINKLKNSNFMEVYNKLIDNNYSYKDISRILLANVILENDEIDYEATFTIEDLQDYLGYFKLKNSRIVLTRYQSDAIRNMRESYKTYRYTNVILPTGTGKSFVAISEMLEYLINGKKVLYLAPDREILNQIKYYLVTEVIGDKFDSDIDTIVKEKYPNLIMTTYTDLVLGYNKQKIISDKYDFIVSDELHRTGAKEWKKQIEALFNNQDISCKVLGITATPTRDCDGIDMAEYWAKFFGYTDEEIYSNKHLAYNMDYNQAIAFGYLANPRVINCDYEFFTESEEIKTFTDLVQKLTDEDQKRKYLLKLKSDIANSRGVSELLRENVTSEDRCLVFCPIVDFDTETGERLSDEQKIKKYIKKLEEIYGKDKIECYSMLGSYSDRMNQEQLLRFNNSSSDKIKFMLVLNKMNEGKHGKYNKIIWFRTLDDNSYVLCSQQLGRISKLIKRGKQLSESERPLVIDIPNNLLRIQRDAKLKKSVKGDDISKFKLVVDWIKEYNKIPEINSKDYIESSMAATLKLIIFTYHKLVQDIESIEDIKKKILVKEIKRLSEELEFDIWSLNLPKRTLETKKRRKIPYYAKVNPIYRDYLDTLEMLKNKSVFELRFAEILEFYDQFGEIPNEGSKYRNIRFKDNSALISKWIMYYKNAIIEYAKQGNEVAQLIVNIRGWNLSREEKIVKRIYELYDILIETGNIPANNTTLKFSDGANIVDWISSTKNKYSIVQLALSDDLKAKYIIEQSGWNIDDIINRKNKIDSGIRQMSLNQRIDEIYDIIQSGKNIHDGYFSDGININDWIYTDSYGKCIITKKAREGNVKAIEIAKRIDDIVIEKKTILFDDKIEEIYNYFKNNGFRNFPLQQKDGICFSDGTVMGNFLNSKKTKKILLERAKNGDAKAMLMCLNKCWFTKKEALEFFDENYEIENGVKLFESIDFLKKIDDIIIFTLKYNKFPTKVTDDDYEKGLFQWLAFNSDLINQYALFEKKCFYIGLQIASFIRDDIKQYYDDTKFEINTGDGKRTLDLLDENLYEKKLKRCVEIYITSGKFPCRTSNSQELTNLGAFIANYRDTIIRSSKTNPYAMFICLRMGRSATKTWLKKEDALEYYPNGYKFDGISLYNESELSFDDKINEIFELLKNDKLHNKSKLSDGTNILYWKTLNEEKIIQSAKEGNGKAMYICLDPRRNAKKIISIEEALEYYPFDYVIDNVSLFNGINKTFEEYLDELCTFFESKTFKFSQGPKYSNEVSMTVWLKNNKTRLISLAKSGNEKALFICKQRNWLQEENGKLVIKTKEMTDEEIFNKKIDCLIDYYLRYNKMPERNDPLNEQLMEQYGFGLEIFLHSYRNAIIKRALTDIKCMFICLRAGAIRNKNWIKNEEALSIYPEDSYIEINIDGETKKISLYEKSIDEKRIDEIYNLYVSTGILYNQNTKEYFSDNSICIGTWIKRNREYIMEQANLGNEHAKTIVEASVWTKNYAPKIANINLYALKICLSNGWLLETDVSEYPTYKEYKGMKK